MLENLLIANLISIIIVTGGSFKFVRWSFDKFGTGTKGTLIAHLPAFIITFLSITAMLLLGKVYL